MFDVEFTSNCLPHSSLRFPVFDATMQPRRTTMSWLHTISWVFIGLGVITALILMAEMIRHPQHMSIMNVVWPITGVYFPVIGVLFYRWFGSPTAAAGSTSPAGEIFLSSSHCGSGCVIGDIIGAPIVFFTGLTILGSRLFAEFVVEFVLAYAFGIIFQYIPIRSMRNISRREALVDAVKADTLSLVAFQVGLFGWMAIVHYLLMPVHPPEANSPVFWFMMQIGMVLGFLTTWPANAFLIQRGIKMAM
jgi:Domain of unknown function (DUF4396)